MSSTYNPVMAAVRTLVRQGDRVPSGLLEHILDPVSVHGPRLAGVGCTRTDLDVALRQQLTLRAAADPAVPNVHEHLALWAHTLIDHGTTPLDALAQVAATAAGEVYIATVVASLARGRHSAAVSQAVLATDDLTVLSWACQAGDCLDAVALTARLVELWHTRPRDRQEINTCARALMPDLAKALGGTCDQWVARTRPLEMVTVWAAKTRNDPEMGPLSLAVAKVAVPAYLTGELTGRAVTQVMSNLVAATIKGWDTDLLSDVAALVAGMDGAGAVRAGLRTQVIQEVRRRRAVSTRTKDKAVENQVQAPLRSMSADTGALAQWLTTTVPDEGAAWGLLLEMTTLDSEDYTNTTTLAEAVHAVAGVVTT